MNPANWDTVKYLEKVHLGKTWAPTEYKQKPLLLDSGVFPAGSDGKESSWVRKIPWRREWLPTAIFLPGESHGQRSLVGYSPRGHKESDRTERLTLSVFHCEMKWYKVGLCKASGRNTLRRDSKRVQSHSRLNESQVNVLLWPSRVRLQRPVKPPGTGHHGERPSSDTHWARSRGGWRRLVPGDRARARNQAASALAAPPPRTPQDPWAGTADAQLESCST